MALLDWNDNLSVNIAELDSQHKKIVVMINELHDALIGGKGNGVLSKIIHGLIAYTVTHFNVEERYFAKYSYPDTAEHKKEHAAMVKKVSEFKDGFDKGKIHLTLEIMDFLIDWLKTHIIKTDKKYSKFFHEKGLK